MTNTLTQTIKVSLVGNPNVGKSVIFNYLTGSYADVSNYPGTTIEIANAAMKGSLDPCFRIFDTPGVYGISSLNDEERATRDYVLEADIVINVVSALTLQRDLFLTKQLCDLGKPMLLVINQCDEAKLRKVEINSKLLSERLKLNIIETVATDGIGLDDIQKAILASLSDDTIIAPGAVSTQIEPYINKYIDQVLTRTEALMIAEADIVIAKKNNIILADDAIEQRETIYKIRRKEVNEILDGLISSGKFSKRVLFGNLLLNPWIGSIVAATVLYLFLYQFLGVFIAGTVVDIFEKSFFQKYYEPTIRALVNLAFPINYGELNNIVFSDPLRAIGTFLAGDYGVLTLTITYLYGLLMPLVFGFYFGLAILEDSGYLPRLAVLVDGVLTSLGMNGRAIIPLILGGGCVTMAVVTTRLLTSNKEKIITMALLGLTIPCSAQLGVIQGLLSNVGGIKPWLIWSGTLLVVFVAVGSILNKLVPGNCGHFISDIPPLRLPKPANLVKKTVLRSNIFLQEATPAFFIAAALVASLQITGLLSHVIKLCEPIVSKVLLLPKEVTLSFILGMVRRDFGAFGLLNIPMTAGQLITACVVLTLFVPCIATVAVMIKEKNWQTALAIWISSWGLALGLGAVLARLIA